MNDEEKYLKSISATPADDTSVFNSVVKEIPEKELKRFMRQMKGTWNE